MTFPFNNEIPDLSGGVVRVASSRPTEAARAECAPALATLRLYDLEETYEALLDTEGVVGLDPEQRREIVSQIAVYGAAVERKRDNVARVLKQLYAHEDAIELEISNLRQKAEAAKRRRVELEGYVIPLIEEHGKEPRGAKSKQLAGHVFVLSAQSNPPSVFVADGQEWLLPSEYQRFNLKNLTAEQRGAVISACPDLKDAAVECSADRKAILRDLKAGVDIPVAELRQSKRLVVK